MKYFGGWSSLLLRQKAGIVRATFLGLSLG